jgi:hypothetical protein
MVVDSESPTCQIDVRNPAAQHASAFQARPQRRKLETITQRRTDQTRRAIDFVGMFLNMWTILDFPIPDQWSALR